MALSKNFFGLRHGSTKSSTYSEYRGKQITKDRVSGGHGNAVQAKRFSDMAKAYNLFKGMISREDFFREAQKVDVVRYTDDGFPLAPWPCSWGSGHVLSISNYTSSEDGLEFDVNGLFCGWMGNHVDDDYWLFDVDDVQRFQILPLLDACLCLREFVLIYDFWIKPNTRDTIKHVSSSCRIATRSDNLSSTLVKPNGLINASDFALWLNNPLNSDSHIAFLVWNAGLPGFPSTGAAFHSYVNYPKCEIVMCAVRVIIDGRLSKSFCYVP